MEGASERLDWIHTIYTEQGAEEYGSCRYNSGVEFVFKTEIR